MTEDKRVEYQRIYEAVPVGSAQAVRARQVAEMAGVDIRSCGTKLTAMQRGTGMYDGLRSRYVEDHGGVHLWFRES